MIIQSDIDKVISNTMPAQDAEVWVDVMVELTRFAEQQRSGTQIRIASPVGSHIIEKSGAAAWTVATFGEPATIIISNRLQPGKPTWHAARMIVALGGTPTNLQPGETAILQSHIKPPNGWDDISELKTDKAAKATLRSMGLPRWLVRIASR